MLGVFNGIQYYKVLPKKYNSSKKYPVLFVFHGAGCRDRNDFIGAVKEFTIYNYLKDNGDVFNGIVIYPRCQGNLTWFDMISDVEKMIKCIISENDVDTNRVYLTGNSMGGYACYQLLMNLDVFASALICCGGGMYWNASSINTPVYAVHGKEDDTVYYQESEHMIEKIKEKGVETHLEILEGVGHNCWNYAYSNPSIYKWLFSKTLK